MIMESDGLAIKEDCIAAIPSYDKPSAEPDLIVVRFYKKKYDMIRTQR